jgi:hypothetical protein
MPIKDRGLWDLKGEAMGGSRTSVAKTVWTNPLHATHLLFPDFRATYKSISYIPSVKKVADKIFLIDPISTLSAFSHPHLLYKR